MLIPHIALKYEVTIRSYGAVSTTFRRRAGWLQQPPTDELPRLAIATPPLAPTLSSPPGSTSCPHDEEDSEFIRKRKRRARGPPPGPGRGAQSRGQRSPPGPTDTIDPVIHDELYSLDPIPPDDA